MKNLIGLLFVTTLIFCFNVSAQWLPDVRLTNNTGISYTSFNRPCIASSGDILHIVWHDNRNGNTEVYYKRSTGAGTTWSSDMRLTNNSANSEFPTIAVLGLNVYVVWHDGRDTTNEIYFNKSTDAGITWGADTRITFAPGESNFPVIAVSGTTMHVAWHDYRNGNAEIYYKQSTDEGASWSADIRMTVSAGVSAFTQLSISGPTVHLIWQDNRHGDGEIYYVRSSNSGVNWSTEVRITNSGGISAYPTVSSSGSTVHLAWWDERSYPAEIYYKKSSDDGLNWGTDVRLTNSSGASYDPFIYSSGTLVHIVWIDMRDGNFEIYYKGSSDEGANWSIDYRTTNNPGVSESNSMIANGPKVHVLWQDTRDGNSEIYYKQNPIGNTLIAIDSVSPNNKVSIPLNSDMKAYFNQNMNASTIDSSSVIFFGSMTGRKQGIFNYNSGEKSVTINPQYDFKYGELVSTTLRSSIRTGTDNFITPFVWSFTTLTNPSNSVFNRSDSVMVGSNPHKMTNGDYDGDGDLDLAVTNSASNTVSILRNNGYGTFTLSNEPGVGIEPDGIVTGDLDNDGDLDLAVANGGSNTVSILKNNGTGAFILSSNVAVGPAGGIVTGDIDGDGDLDLAVTNRGSNNISILRNDGTGSFTVSSTVALTSPQGIAIGDFDNDGDLDLCIVEYWASRVSILKNDGTGTFTITSIHGVGNNTDQVITGDFDNDLDLDLAVTNNSVNYMSILKNDGTGAFMVTNIGAAGLTGITQGDFDGDGYLDLAVNNFGLRTVSIYKNSGTGSFTLFSSIAAGNWPFYITAGDFNNNGVLDLAVNNYYNSMITVLMNLTSPQLLTPVNNSVGNLNVLNFSWNKSPGAENYRFQLSTDSLFGSYMINDSTSLGTDSVKNISGLTPLTWYYWRMNSKSANGSSLWSEVWNFKTQGAPTQVVLNAPANNAINQPVNINFVWYKAIDQVLSRAGINKGINSDGSDNVNKYWFELSTDSLFSNVINIDSTLSDTTNSVNGLINLTNYYWRVRAKNETGWGNYSAWFKFTTIISAPSAPMLVSPPHNAVGQNLSLMLVWNKVPTAVNYRVQVATDSLFTNLIANDSTLTDSTKVISGLNPLTFYWWRVSAKNVGGTSVYSSVFRFKTMGAPTQVILFAPPNNAINQPVNLTCVWRRSTDLLAPWVKNTGLNADENELISNYWFDMVTDTVSMANLLRDTTLTDSAKAVSGLSYLTSYFWRVKAKNQIGWGSYSVWFKFTTIPLPPALVNLTVIPGGFFNSGTNQLFMRDTIRVYLVDSVSCLAVDSSKGVVDSVNFSMPLSFGNAATGSYYMLVYHRNHLGVATRFKQNIVRGSSVSYDFTTDSAKAFGFNMVKVSTSPVRWGMIPGDANRDGFIDAIDQFTWVAQNGLDGYLAADFNGDGFVDAIDQAIWVTFNGLSSFMPCGFTLEPGTQHLIQNAPDYDAKKGRKIMNDRKNQDKK